MILVTGSRLGEPGRGGGEKEEGQEAQAEET
jgi:hypothetical protein